MSPGGEHYLPPQRQTLLHETDLESGPSKRRGLWDPEQQMLTSSELQWPGPCQTKSVKVLGVRLGIQSF